MEFSIVSLGKIPGNNWVKVNKKTLRILVLIAYKVPPTYILINNLLWKFCDIKCHCLICPSSIVWRCLNFNVYYINNNNIIFWGLEINRHNISTLLTLLHSILRTILTKDEELGFGQEATGSERQNWLQSHTAIEP